jgi:hypothetical protein
MQVGKLYTWFFENTSNLKSFSPETGKLFVSIKEDLDKAIPTVKDKEIQDELIRYREALDTVCITGIIQQKAVIDKFITLVEKLQKKGKK